MSKTKQIDIDKLKKFLNTEMGLCTTKPTQVDYVQESVHAQDGETHIEK